MKEKKRLYCYLDLAEQDNTSSDGKQWKSVFVSYLSHILNNNYNIQFLLIDPNTTPIDSGVEREKDVFFHLKILSNQNSQTLHNIEHYSSLFDKTESIGIVKELLDNTILHSNAFRIFDLCPIDLETGQPIKSDLLFEKENVNVFLSKIADLSFEISHLITGQSSMETPYIYLAEAAYELTSVRYAVKKELIKRGYRVLPENKFPSEKDELQEHIIQDLKKSVLSIHFFGNNFSAPHPQTGLQMDIFQNSVAVDFFKEQYSLSIKGENTTTNFRRIIWMPENSRIKNEKHLKFIDALKHDPSLYAGSDLIRSSPEELKDIILLKLSGHTTKAEAAPGVTYTNNEITPMPEEGLSLNRVETQIISTPQHEQESYSRIILPEQPNFFQ